MPAAQPPQPFARLKGPQANRALGIRHRRSAVDDAAADAAMLDETHRLVQLPPPRRAPLLCQTLLHLRCRLAALRVLPLLRRRARRVRLLPLRRLFALGGVGGRLHLRLAPPPQLLPRLARRRLAGRQLGSQRRRRRTRRTLGGCRGALDVGELPPLLGSPQQSARARERRRTRRRDAVGRRQRCQRHLESADRRRVLVRGRQQQRHLLRLARHKPSEPQARRRPPRRRARAELVDPAPPVLAEQLGVRAARARRPRPPPPRRLGPRARRRRATRRRPAVVQLAWRRARQARPGELGELGGERFVSERLGWRCGRSDGCSATPTPTATSTSAATTAATTVAQGLRCELLRQRLVLHRAETRRGSGGIALRAVNSPAARRASL